MDRFLAEGARVTVAQRTEVDDVLAADERVLAIRVDLADPTSLEGVVQETIDHFGGLDVVVNNAGVMFERDLESMSFEEWATMLAINVTAPVFLVKAALPHLRGGGAGAIVNIGSTEGLGSNPGHVAYSASKGAVHAITRAMAVDLGSDGIRVNTIAPGWIASELSNDYLASLGDASTVEARLNRLHPIGRVGTPEDIGDLAVFLASDRAGFLTGETIVVDGGRMIKLSNPGD